jgi:hypothetical protein
VVTNHEDTAVVAAASAGANGAFVEWPENGTGDSSDPNPVSLDAGGINLQASSLVGPVFSYASNRSPRYSIASGATDTVRGFYKCWSPQAGDVGRVSMSVGQGQATVAVRTTCDLN